MPADEAVPAQSAGGLRLPCTWGEYRLERFLGEGGVGEVYEGVHVPLRRRVAVKVLRAQRADDEETRARFVRGAQAAAALDHGHVVPILHFGRLEDEHGGARPVLVMPLLSGGSLEDLLRSLREAGEDDAATQRALDAARLAPAARADLSAAERLAGALAPVARALAAVHAAGMVHRDVKPANLLLDERGRVLLTDFDLVQDGARTALTATGSLLGTPHFMSPEQCDPRLGPVGPASDVYGLGAVLYALLTRHVPYEGESLARLVRLIPERGPRDPRELAPRLSADAVRVMQKALERRPGDRYADASALADDLEALAQGRPVLARPPRLARRALRTARRRWRELAATGALLAAATWWFGLRPAVVTLEAVALVGQVRVEVDGVDHGRLPLAAPLTLGRGAHEVRWLSPEYEPHSEVLRVRAGEMLSRSPLLVPSTAASELAHALYRHARLLEAPGEPPPRTVVRSDEAGRFTPLLPRGRVSVEALTLWGRYRPPLAGRITLVGPDGVEVFGRDAVLDGASELRERVPLEAVLRLEAGATYVWGFRPAAAPGQEWPLEGVSFVPVAPAADEAGVGAALARLTGPAGGQLARAATLAAEDRSAESLAMLLDPRWLRRPDDAARWALAWKAVERLALEDTTLADDVHGAWQAAVAAR